MPKTPEEWKIALLKDWPSRALLGVLTVSMGYVWAQGNHIIEKKILDTVKPVMDTLARKVETTDQKVEKVDAKLDAMIQVMIEAFPEFKKAAQERAQKMTDSKGVRESLTGDGQ
jgi:hypothetical protein